MMGLLVWGSTLSVRAQWTNQAILLRPGWNSVYLEIDPEPADCDTQFAGLPIESVWVWNKRFSAVQFIQDPGTLIPGQPDWLTYVSPTSTNGIVKSLYSLVGNRAYLIKVANNGPTVTWNVKGRPLVRSTEWLADSFNYVGFHVDTSAAPTFANYFAGSSSHAGQPIYRLNASGTWSGVNPATERPNAGEAYWVRCQGSSTFAGPISVSLDQARSLDYDQTLTEQNIVIANTGTNSKTITLQQLPSAGPPGSGYPALAGDVPLSYWVINSPSNIGFYPLPGTLTNTLAPGDQWSLRLAVRRSEFAAYTPQAPYTNALYQKLLQVSDGAGSRVLVPVSAKGVQSFAGVGGVQTGLWVGSATINKVSQGSDTNLASTASPFQFRLLLHQNTNGAVNLLRQVLVVASTNQPGQYSLITNLRSNTVPYDVVVRQFSSAAFGFYGKQTMAPAGVDFTQEGATLSTTNILYYNDPLNPFVHLYHPDHNNADDFGTNFTPSAASANWPADMSPGPKTSESFTVTRYITLKFSTNDPDGLKLSGWQSSQVGGSYSEVITGLHKNALRVQGTFRLHQATSTGWLDAGP